MRIADGQVNRSEKPHERSRNASLVLGPQATLRLHRAKPSITVTLTRQGTEDPDGKPRGIAVLLRPEVSLDGFVLDWLVPGGLVAPPTVTAKAVLGKNCLAAREALIATPE